MENLNTLIGIAVCILSIATTLYPNLSRKLRFKLILCWFIVGGLLLFFSSNRYKHYKLFDESKIAFRCYQFPPVIADADKFYYRFIAILENKYPRDYAIDDISFRIQTRLDINEYDILLNDLPDSAINIGIKNISELTFSYNKKVFRGGQKFGLSIDCSKPKGKFDIETHGATVSLSYTIFGKNHKKDYHINPMSIVDLRYPKKSAVLFDEIQILDHRMLPDRFFSYHYYKGEDESGERRIEIYCPDDKEKFLRISYKSPNNTIALDSQKRIHNDIDPIRFLVLSNDDIKIYSWIGKFRLTELAEHFRKGLKKVEEKQFRDAATEFDAITEIDSKDYQAWFNAGLSLELSGDLDNAIHRFESAIEAKNDYPKAHCELGNVYIKKENNDKAIEFLKKAIYLKPDYALAYFRLGCLQKTMGMIDEAINNLNEAIKHEKNLDRANMYKKCLRDTEYFDQFDEQLDLSI